MTNTKTLIAATIAAAFAFPLAAAAADDKKSESSAAATQSKSNDGGAEAMFKALDKDKDGFLSKDEAKGTPHDKDFTSLDKNKDGKLSRDEHAAAPEHAGKAGAAAASGAPTADAKKK